MGSSRGDSSPDGAATAGDGKPKELRTAASRRPTARGQKSPSTRAATRLQAIVFEVENVLYDGSDCGRWLAHVTSPCCGVAIEPLRAIWENEFRPAVKCGESDRETVLEAFLRTRGLASCQAGEILAASVARRRTWEATTRLFPGVLRTLAALKKHGLQLAVLADCEDDADVLRARLERLGVACHFDCVLCSRDLNSLKPAAASYRAVLAALQVQPDLVAMVSHSASDLAGAQLSGMQTVAFNPETALVADCVVQHVDELIGLAAQASRPSAAA